MKVQNFFTQEDSAFTFNDEDRATSEVLEYANTSEIDAFRHGVEIRTNKQYVAGSVKILSGERGHALTPQPIGQSTNSNAVRFDRWTDKAAFYPLEFVAANGWQEPFYINDNVDDATIYDGVIRSNSLDYNNISAQRTSRTIATLIDGNTSQINGGSSKIMSVDDFDEQNAGYQFNDGTDTDASASTTLEIATICPYLDSENVCYNVFNKEFWPNQAPAEIDISVVNLIIQSNARDDSYVQSWQASMPAGFQFDSGTDSIAFGDMQY